jgi:ureidoacrylate peracid hydrolase
MQPPVRLSLADKLVPTRACLLVVDVQNDFCSPDGYFARVGNDVSAVAAMMERLHALIDAARAAGALVVFVQAIYDEHVLSAPWRERNIRRNLEVPRCITGSWGAELYEVKPQPGDVVVRKHRYSAFVDTELDMILRARGIETLVMTGVASNVCVESTARDGFMKDYYIVFTSDASATTSPAVHEATLQNVRDYFGVVASAAEVIATWQGPPAA